MERKAQTYAIAARSLIFYSDLQALMNQSLNYILKGKEVQLAPLPSFPPTIHRWDR